MKGEKERAEHPGGRKEITKDSNVGKVMKRGQSCRVLGNKKWGFTWWTNPLCLYLGFMNFHFWVFWFCVRWRKIIQVVIELERNLRAALGVYGVCEWVTHAKPVLWVVVVYGWFQSYTDFMGGDMGQRFLLHNVPFPTISTHTHAHTCKLDMLLPVYTVISWALLKLNLLKSVLYLLFFSLGKLRLI